MFFIPIRRDELSQSLEAFPLQNEKLEERLTEKKAVFCSFDLL
jgi:hypothetical protein